MSGLVTAIRSNPRWEQLALAGLSSTDNREFYEAERTARSLGIDTFDTHWTRLLANPIRGNWWAVMQAADEERIEMILDFAKSVLLLDEIASGPAMSLGMGPRWAAHGALDFIVQDLKRFPGKGWIFVDAALRSPVVRNRNMAVNVLSTWEVPVWPSEAREAIAVAIREEPDVKVKERLEELLARSAP
jgi:hypothetical protein